KTFHQGFGIACHFIACACYASARNCVDESARVLRDAPEPFVRCRWRDQKDRIESMLKQVLSPRLCFLGNQICHEDSVDSRLSRCRGEWFWAELQERIEITEEDDGHINVLPDVPRAGERVAYGHAVSQRSFRRALNQFPIRNRIAERHAQLDDVRSRLRELNEQALSSCKIRVTYGDEWDETTAS